MKNYEDVCKSKFLPTPLVSSHQELFFFRKKKKEMWAWALSTQKASHITTTHDFKY